MVASKLSQLTTKGMEAATSSLEHRQQQSNRPSDASSPITTTGCAVDITHPLTHPLPSEGAFSADDWDGRSTTEGNTNSLWEHYSGQVYDYVDAAKSNVVGAWNYMKYQEVGTEARSPPTDGGRPSYPSLLLKPRRTPLSHKWIWALSNPFSSAPRLPEHVRGVNPSVLSVRSMLSLMSAISEDKETPQLTTPKCDGADKSAATIANSDDDTSPPSFSKSPSDLSSRQIGAGVSDAETASRLAEGTVMALRDLTLDEAVELNASLQFWTARWESPLLSWIEAGPVVWFSKMGYNHQLIGQKVSQIQAVLARRIASAGELQQHLWRAGWQKGVAQWGVLGQGGGQWAPVVGGGGTIEDQVENSQDLSSTHSNMESVEILPRTPVIGQKNAANEMDVNVNNTPGGEILSNEAALAAWSVDAVKLIRDQMYRAGNGVHTLPYFENWSQEESHFKGQSRQMNRSDYVPIWATVDVGQSTDSASEDNAFGDSIMISDLPLMAMEVSELLTYMEWQMEEQRNRRLAKLKPPLRIVRDWYIVAASLPFLGYIGYKFAKDRWGVALCKQLLSNISEFYAEHVSEPVRYVYTQLFTNRIREDVTDQVARMNAIESLRKMLRSWLDETYPNMDAAARENLAESMDMSLVEKRKEDSVKRALYEISDIVRMSLIEMQFIKKELMNAMSAMDDLMQSNEFNFKLAAMTPAILIVFGATKCFRFCRYALLKVGKSREQIHESLRLVVLDVERLLVMRDCPPSAPPPLAWEMDESKDHVQSRLFVETTAQTNVLGSDDLGMLMLLIHECRTIMWNNPRRFSRHDLRSMAEDLAELSGERGPVSVKQQLSIVSRMFRTYPFLKVVSSGGYIDVNRFV